MAKFTIRELAQLAGVSQTAVSFVLNGRPGVSDETRQKVLDIIEQTNYKSDRNSKRLALRKSFNICLAYLDTSSPFDDLFYFEVAKGMIDSSNAYGYNIVLNKIDLRDGTYVLPEVITGKDADGVIVFQDIAPQMIRTIESYGLPCVILDSYANLVDCLSIGIDAAGFTREAVRYLLERGHRKIGLIGSSYIPDYWIQAYGGYVDALVERQLMINPAWVQNTARDEATAYGCMENILRAGPPPTAVFCVGDIYAIGAVRCLKDRGLRVPDDMSIIGADNIVLSKYLEPALTTVNFNKEEMGRMALELLVRRINGEPVESIRMSSCGILERGSVRALGDTSG